MTRSKAIAAARETARKLDTVLHVVHDPTFGDPDSKSWYVATDFDLDTIHAGVDPEMSFDLWGRHD